MDTTEATKDDDRPIEPPIGPDGEPQRFLVLSPDQRRLVAHPITPRELEVLRLLARGRTNRQIARSLGVSESTIKAHCSRLFARIGVHNRTEAAVWAACNGVLYGASTT